MPDIINAKCFGCGRVIRVPSSLGGRNARCPQCGHVFTIPTPADSTMDIVSDEDLPAVAAEEEILEGEILPEGSSLRARQRGTSRRVGPRETGSRRLPVVRKRNPAVLVGCIVGGAALLAVILILALRGGPAKESKHESPVATERKPDPEGDALQARARDFLAAFRTARLPDIVEFCEAGEKERHALKTAITAQLEAGVRYDDIVFRETKVKGNEGTVSFSCAFVRGGAREENKLVSLQWRRSGADAPWRLVEPPGK